jgi:hypothetical protein
LTAWCLRGSIVWLLGVGRSENRQAGGGDPLAPRRLLSILAVEITPAVARPTTPAEICQLIRQMSVANPLWGAPRIHGELLNLGWNAFLRNHVIRSFGDVRSMSGLRETGRAEPLRPGSSLGLCPCK